MDEDESVDDLVVIAGIGDIVRALGVVVGEVDGRVGEIDRLLGEALGIDRVAPEPAHSARVALADLGER